ncbi:MAG: cupin domain-containing protein [Oscillospiraceae bacterium]|nr:cupin domain-containing protein [Oscillospiraceae bacterium]
MLIDFNAIQPATFPGMNNGSGTMTARMFYNEQYRIISTVLHPGSSIGLHTQTSGDDLNYIISGHGRAVCDGVEEALSAGAMHICPKGSEHSIINDSDDDLVFLTIVAAR